MGGNIIDITAFSPPTVQPLIKYRRVSLKMGGGVRDTPLVSVASWQKHVEFQFSRLINIWASGKLVVGAAALQRDGPGLGCCTQS